MVVQIYHLAGTQILFTGLFYMEFVHWQDRMGGGGICLLVCFLYLIPLKEKLQL